MIHRAVPLVVRVVVGLQLHFGQMHSMHQEDDDNDRQWDDGTRRAAAHAHRVDQTAPRGVLAFHVVLDEFDGRVVVGSFPGGGGDDEGVFA